MSYIYEVTIDEEIYEVFRLMTARVLEPQGFKAGLHVSSHRGAGVIEFHRGNEVVTFSATNEPHDQYRLVVSSETVDVVPLIVAVVEHVTIQLTASFWAPALGLSQGDLATKVARSIRRIWQRASARSDAQKDG